MRKAKWPTARLTTTLARLALGVMLVFLWWLAAHLHWLSPDLLPSPGLVVIGFFQLAVSPQFWAAFGYTVLSAMTALLIAIAVAVPLGLALGLVPKFEQATRFLLDLGRSFPVIALLPVMVLLMGTTMQMEIIVIFLAVVWPILLQTIYGSRRMDPVVRDTTRAYQVSVWLRFTKVLLPAAAPFTATGIRVAASISILLAVGVEVLSKTPGLGFRLAQAQEDARPDIALAYILYAGLLGILLNFLLWRLEDKLLVWNARADKEGVSA